MKTLMSRGLLSPTGISAMWFGMLVSIALSAAMKFRAPTMSKAVGLDVGRYVFYAFGALEWCVFLLLCLSFFFTKKNVPFYILLGFLALCLSLQAFWLRPILEGRALAFMDKQVLEPSSIHIVYVSLEGVKLLLLFITSWLSSK